MPATFGYEVISNSVEKDFASDLVNYITGLDDRITCSNNAETEYDSSDLTHVPTFNFLIDNEVAFTLTRSLRNNSGGGVQAPLSSNSTGFLADFGDLNVYMACFNMDGLPYTQSGVRKFAISSVLNSNFILLSINGLEYYYGNYNTNNTNIIYAKTSTKKYLSTYTGVTFAKNNIFNISTRTFSSIDENINGTFISRFSYACPPGYIDYIKSSVYMNNSQKQFEITSIYDCTTVAIGDTVSLKDGPYLAVGTNQLVKV